MSVPTDNYRRAAERWPSATQLARAAAAVAVAAESDPHGAIEHVKSFTECLCKTILADVGVEPPLGRPPTTELLRTTLAALGLENKRAGTRLDRILSQLNKLTDILTEARNDDGPLAHGKSGFEETLGLENANSYITVGNLIAGCLLSAMSGTEPNVLTSHETVEAFPHMQRRIDASAIVSTGVELDQEGEPTILIAIRVDAGSIPDLLRLRPSEIVYAHDRRMFKELFDAAPIVEASEVDDEDVDIDVMVRGRTGGRSPARDLQPDTYDGALEPLREPLQKKLEDLLGQTDLATASIEALLPVIEDRRGEDWRQRTPLLSNLRLGIRRALASVGLDRITAANYSRDLVDWLRGNDVLRDLEDG